jgi:hypothetical protein
MLVDTFSGGPASSLWTSQEADNVLSIKMKLLHCPSGRALGEMELPNSARSGFMVLRFILGRSYRECVGVANAKGSAEL